MYDPDNIHPNNFVKDLILKAHESEPLTEEETKKLKLDTIPEHEMASHEVICHACGWTDYAECITSYIPRIRMECARLNSGLWSVGNKWLMWDKMTDGSLGNDFITWKFLKEKGTKDIPILDEMIQLNEPDDPVQMTLITRAKGVPLSDIWDRISREEREGYQKQIVAAIKEMRQITSPVPCAVDGTPMIDRFIGCCGFVFQCNTIKNTREEWLDGLAEELKYGLSATGDPWWMPTEAYMERMRAGFREYKVPVDPAVGEAKFQKMKAWVPQSGPFVLTHGDLHLGNIIVHDGKITAIIDWETAGFLPWWVEYYTLRERTMEWFDWEMVDPHFDTEGFFEKVSKPINILQRAYQACPKVHTEEHEVWKAPPTNESRPFRRRYRKKFWGAELKHSFDHAHKDTHAYIDHETIFHDNAPKF